MSDWPVAHPFVHEIAVPESDMDRQGRANNVAYVRWMMEAAAAHSAALGWPPERYEKLGKMWVVRRAEIEYLWPVAAGETVTVATWPETLAAASSVRCYEMRNGAGKPVARGSNQWAWVDAKRGRPLRVDAEVREAFDPAKFR